MMNAVKGDLLNAGRNIMEASVDEGTPSIDGVRGHIRRQLEGLQLHHQGWRLQKQESYQYRGNGNQNGGIPGIHLTRHHGVRLGQPRPSSTGLFFSGMKGSLRDPEMDPKLAIFLSHLRIMVLGHPPLSEEALGIIAVVRVRGIRQRGRCRRCSIRGLASLEKRTKTVIQNKPIDQSEQFIIMNKRCQSHLMRRRRWFTSMFSSQISSAARLPRLSSPAMEFG